MNNEQRIAEQMERGLTRTQACMLLGIAYTAPPVAFDKVALRDMAIETLGNLIAEIQRAPANYKPNEIIAACKEALDRTDGKAAQAITIDAKTSVTHTHIMSLPPAEAYRQLMEIDVIDMGGVAAEGAAG